MVIIFGVLFASRWIDLTGLFLLTCITIFGSRLKFKTFVRDWYALRYFLAITVLIHLLMAALYRNPSNAGWDVVFMSGFSVGALFAVKIILMAAIMSAVLRTTHPAGISRAAGAMLPHRQGTARSSSRIGLIFGLSLRFLPMILAEAERIRRSQIGRGLEITGGPVRRVKSLVPLIAPLLSSSLDRAEGITAAMRSRGFSIHSKRTVYRPLRVSRLDLMALIIIAILVGVMMVGGWT